ncbi:MAG TPA: DUF4397 domain-containing protein [Steroidobacteraceae bacterium]|nr:DUF4397 domain-containing protein [Steroidobacteraceae bacterium]
MLLAVALAVAAVGLVGCKKVLNGGSDEDVFHVRMLNLLTDSATVQYSIDSTVVASSAYTGVTTFNPAHPGEHTVSFALIRPASLNSSDPTDPIPIAGSFQGSYAKNTDYTIFAYGTTSNPHAFTMDEPSNRPTPAAATIEYQLVNASPSTPNADVYITAPEGGITSATKVATLAFGAKSTPTTMTLTRRPDVTDTTAPLIVDFTIELRDPASGAELFNSGKIRLTEKTRVLWALADNVGPGPSKVKLVGIDGVTGTTLDINDQAQVRVVHVSPDSGAFDVFRDSTDTPIATNVAFRDSSPYVNAPAGNVDVFAMPAGSQAVTIVFVAALAPFADNNYSIYTVGNQGAVGALTLTDLHRSVPTQSSFRFLNVAPSLDGQDALDVYLTLPGQALDFTTTDTNNANMASKFKRGTIGYKGGTDFIVLKSGTYQVRMTPTGTSRIVLDTTFTVQDGSVQTLAVIDDLPTASLELMPVEEALTDR